METILEVLIRRDSITENEALSLIDEAKEAIYEYLEDNDEDAAYNVCAEFFGLEPDYLIELM